MFIIYKPVFSNVLSGRTFRFTFLMNRSPKTRGERKTGPAPSYKVLPEVYARMARLGAWGEWLRAGNCWHEALTLGWGFIWFWIPISNSKAISCNLWPIWCSRWLRDHHQGITGSQHVNARSIVWNLWHVRLTETVLFTLCLFVKSSVSFLPLASLVRSFRLWMHMLMYYMM